jgi:prepilin-type processing-associated H-X9-DG protein
MIELVSVIGIVMVLASLGAATILRVRQRGDSVVCKNHLRQMGAWLTEFVTERNEYPLAFNRELTNRYTDHAATWTGSLRRAGGFPDVIREGDAGDIFRCPRAKRPKDLALNEGYGAYGYNGEGIVGSVSDKPLGLGGKGGENDAGYPPPVRAGEVVSPTEMLAIGDSFVGWRSMIMEGRSHHIGLIFTVAAREGETSRALGRHARSGNYVFCDSHVESLLLEKLYFHATGGYAHLWNRDNQAHLERLNAD